MLSMTVKILFNLQYTILLGLSEAFLKYLAYLIFLAGLTACSFEDSNEVPQLSKWQNYQHNNQASFRAVFANEQSLWVSGSKNTVLKSTDQGKSWQDVSVKSEITTDFRDIIAFDNKTAIVMGAGSGEKSTLFKTNDGGQSWQQLYQNSEPKGFFNSFDFWSQSTGLMLGDPVDGYYVVLKTEDGGQSWRRITIDNLPPILENEAAFAASGNTLRVGDSGKAWIVTGGKSASVYESEDFGESWQRKRVPLHSETGTSGSYALGLNSSKQVVVVGGDYKNRTGAYVNAALNVNGQFIALNTGQHGLRTAISCIDGLCMLTGKTGTDISFDDGLSWQVSPAAQGEGFYTIISYDDVFLAAGEKGKVATMKIKRNN